jgi:hypothetical protein
MCPPGRFLLPLLPIAMLALALRAAQHPRGLARWTPWLTAAGVALALFMIAQPQAKLLLNRRDNPTRVWAALSGGGDLQRYLPSLVSADPADARVAAVWLVLLAALLALDALARRRDRVDALFRWPVLPVAVLIAVWLLTDFWARAGMT